MNIKMDHSRRSWWNAHSFSLSALTMMCSVPSWKSAAEIAQCTNWLDFCLFVCLSLSNWSIKHFGGNCSPKFGRAGMKWRICVCVCVRVLKVDPRQGGWERHHLCCFSLTVESGRVLFKYANVFFSKKGYCGCKYHCGYFSITLMMKRNNNKFESRPSWSSNVI